MIEAKAQKGRNRLQNYQRPHGHILRSWRDGWNIFPYFPMQTRKWRWHVPQSKGLAFFFPSASWAVEEALKTAKSSAAAANKYAIFLLSCLSGCQPFAVRSILRLPCQARTRSQSRSQSWSKSRCRFYAGFKLEKQQNGKQKSQTKRRTHINAIWCLCTSAPSSTILLSFPLFFHIFLLIEFQFDCSFLWARNDGTGSYLIVEWLIVWVLLAFHVAHFVVSQSSCLQSSLGAVCFCNIDGWLDWQADELVCKILLNICYACG